MAWIESHQELGRHPKTIRAAKLLGVSRVLIVGHLQYLWWWCLDYADDGDLSAFDPDEIAEAAEWEGDGADFVTAITQAGFLDDSDGLVVHGWNEYAGKLIDRRKANAKRMRDARATTEKGPENKRAPHMQRTSHARVEPQKRTKPNTTKQNQENDPPNPPGGDKPFDLLVALCEDTGQDVSVLSERDKKMQLAAAKNLVQAGASQDHIHRIYRWLGGQDWVIKGGGVDLKLIAGQYGKWRINGMPESTQPGGRASPHRTTDDGIPLMANGAVDMPAVMAAMRKTG